MNKKLTFLAILFIVTVFSANATIWRVNNNGGINADATTLQEAHDAASAGDTIYLEFSPNTYGNCTFTKQLLVIGTGYFLTENAMTPVQKAGAKVITLTFSSGSEGSIITGLNITTIYNKINNLVLKRNYISSNLYVAYGVSVSNVVIEQNYIIGTIKFESGASNVIISNNILKSYIGMTSSSSATIRNNVCTYTSLSSFFNATFQNNIWADGTASFTNCEVKNNLFKETGTDVDGNQYGIDMSTVFVGTGSTDGEYQLSATSPALGAAIDGGECGAFGGSNPYRLSGVPTVPYIYDATIPTSGSSTGGLPVTIKIRSNN